jgi:hypothetical protein
VRLPDIDSIIGHTEGQVSAVGSPDTFLAPADAAAVPGRDVVGDALTTRAWWEAGHVDNPVLEHDHHGALPSPEGDKQAAKHSGHQRQRLAQV